MKKILFSFTFLFCVFYSQAQLNTLIVDGKTYNSTYIIPNTQIKSDKVNTLVGKLWRAFDFVDTSKRYKQVNLIPGSGISISGIYPNITIGVVPPPLDTIFTADPLYVRHDTALNHDILSAYKSTSHKNGYLDSADYKGFDSSFKSITLTNNTLKAYRRNKDSISLNLSQGIIDIDYSRWTGLISGSKTFTDSTLVPVLPSASSYWNNGLVIKTSYAGGIENSYIKAYDYGNVFNENYTIKLIFRVLDSSTSLRVGVGIKANQFNSSISSGFNAVNWLDIPTLGDTTGTTLNNKCNLMTKTGNGILVNKWNDIQLSMVREIDSVAFFYKNLTTGETKIVGRRAYFTVGPGEYTSVTGWPAIFIDKGNIQIIDFAISKPDDFRYALLSNSIFAGLLTTKRDSMIVKQLQLHTASRINNMSIAGLASPDYLLKSKELDAIRNKVVIIASIDGNNPVFGITNAQSRIYQDSVIKRFRSQGNQLIFIDNTFRSNTLGPGGWAQLDSLNLRLDTIRLPQDSVVHINNLMSYPSDYFGGVHLNDGGNTKVANFLMVSLPKFFEIQQDDRGSFSQVGSSTTTFTVTLGRSMANTNYKVCVIPTSSLAASSFYITNKTLSTFDVVYTSGLTGTVTFDWMITK